MLYVSKSIEYPLSYNRVIRSCYIAIVIQGDYCNADNYCIDGGVGAAVRIVIMTF